MPEPQDDANSPAPMTVRAALAANIKRIRKLRDMSGREFIDRLEQRGVKLLPSGLTALEKGERRLTAEELLVIAVVLNTSVIDLLTPPNGQPLKIADGVDPLTPTWLELWLRGETPWPSVSALDEEFFSTASEPRKAEYRVGLQPEMVQVNVLRSEIKEAIDGPTNNPEPAAFAKMLRDQAARVSAYVDLLADRIENDGYGG